MAARRQDNFIETFSAYPGYVNNNNIFLHYTWVPSGLASSKLANASSKLAYDTSIIAFLDFPTGTYISLESHAAAARCDK